MARRPGSAARAPHANEVTSAENAVYLYCIVRTARLPRMSRVPESLPDAERPIAVEAAPSMWLVLSKVPLAVYGTGPLEKTLKDLDRVASLAVVHEAVVEFFSRSSGAAVVPMKMFTMFSTVERAVAEMGERRAEIDAILDRVAGCEEWGVRVTMRGRPAPRRPAERPRSGKAFLAGRKQARDDARAAMQKTTEAASLAFKELSALAKEARQRTDVPVGGVPPVLDAAFLVRTQGRDKFRAAAKRLARVCANAGAGLTLTGPWPAYNFVQMSTD